MIKKLKIKHLISLIFFFGIIAIIIFTPILDRFNLRKNKVYIDIESKNPKLDDLEVYFYGDDTIYLLKNNEVLESELPDWYGQDRVIVQYGQQKFIHSFGDYKFESFHKTKYRLKIKDYSNDKVLLIWSVKTRWYGNNGVDTLDLSDEPSNRANDVN